MNVCNAETILNKGGLKTVDYKPKGWDLPLRLTQLNSDQMYESQDLLHSNANNEGKNTLTHYNIYNKKLIQFSIIDPETNKQIFSDDKAFQEWIDRQHYNFVSELAEEIKKLNILDEEKLDEEKKS